MKKKIQFIINPISGSKSGIKLPPLIEKTFEQSEFDIEIIFSEYPGHLTELAATAVKNNCFALIVAGGDGTIHEAAKSLVHSNTALGVIPTGSGNGFAGHFKISKNVNRALNIIKSQNIVCIDTLNVNGIPCVATCGVGFDAHVAHKFSKLKKRGFSSYIKLTIQEIFGYHEESYHISIDELRLEQKAFAVTIANTSEYGNHACIAPDANVFDGLLDVCILHDVHVLNFPMVGLRLFSRGLKASANYKFFTGKNATIELKQSAAFHIDGEPTGFTSSLNISVVPKSLQLLVP